MVRAVSLRVGASLSVSERHQAWASMPESSNDGDTYREVHALHCFCFQMHAELDADPT